MFNEINFFNQNTENINNEYVPHFNVMPNDALVSFANNEGLSFTPDQLFFIRNYFLNEKKAVPTITQLKFFDALNNRRRERKNDYPIFSASAIDGGAKEILATSQDFLSKRAVINKKVHGAMPMSFAAEIASEYLKYAGKGEKNRYFAQADEKNPIGYYINGEDDKALFAYVDSNVQSIPQAAPNSVTTAIGNNNAIVMLCPLYPMDDAEYISRVKIFTSLPEITPIISDQNMITKEYTLFDFLKNECNGVFVDISRLPDIQKNEYGKVTSLAPLLDSCYDKAVFATNFASLAIINRISGAYGLMLCHFAMRNDSKTLTLDATRCPAFSFDFNFLNAIEEFKEPREYIFSDECATDIGAKRKVFLTDNRKIEKQSYRAERILNFGKVIASASSRDLGEAPFKTASITVVDAITTLIAKGVALNDISLLINYSLLGGTDNSIELGRNLAAVLGAYRAMIELCVSDSAPKINYNAEGRSITVLSSSKPPIRKLSNTFADVNSYIYFIPYQYDDNGFLNYNKYRASIREYYSYIESDLVISAFAISENISMIINNVCGNSSINYFEGFDINGYASSHGILFESKKELSARDDLVLIGKTVQSISNPDAINGNNINQ